MKALVMLLLVTTLSGCLALRSEDARERPFDGRVEQVDPLRGCGGCS